MIFWVYRGFIQFQKAHADRAGKVCHVGTDESHLFIGCCCRKCYACRSIVWLTKEKCCVSESVAQIIWRDNQRKFAMNDSPSLSGTMFLVVLIKLTNRKTLQGDKLLRPCYKHPSVTLLTSLFWSVSWWKSCEKFYCESYVTTDIQIVMFIVHAGGNFLFSLSLVFHICQFVTFYSLLVWFQFRNSSFFFNQKRFVAANIGFSIFFYCSFFRRRYITRLSN